MAGIRKASPAIETLWERFQKLQEQAKALGAIETEKKQTKADLLEELGDATRVKLRNGNLLQVIEKSRNMSEREATVQVWQELHELPA